MSLKRKGRWLAAWVLAVIAGVPAWAQGLRDAQIFAPAEPSHYGGGVRANQGFFFVYDGLYWTISPPQKATIGVDTNTLAVQRQVWWYADPNATSTQGSTMDTSFLSSDFTFGHRIELGHIHEHTGWMFSYFRLHELSQARTLAGVQVYFNDETWGVNNLPHLYGDVDPGAGVNLQNLGVQFDILTAANYIKVWGTEFDLLVRTHPRQRGGMWEWFFGLRYIEFHEQFDINAIGDPPTGTGDEPGTVLADTYLTSYAKNNLFGPQLGLRWFRANDRWRLSAEGKFMAAWNSQNVAMHGVVGSELQGNFPRPAFWPIAMQATNFAYREYMSVFSPVVELRLEMAFQLTRSVAFRVGWNGMYIDNLARPSRMIDYTLGTTSVMGILRNLNRDLVFMEGVAAGIEINR